MRILGYMFIAAGILVFFYGIAVLEKKQHCRDSHDTMVSFYDCTQKPGCFYDAEQWEKARKAHTYYQANCPEG